MKCIFPRIHAAKINGTKRIITSVVVAVASMGWQWSSSAAGPEAVNLGSTAHFTILAGAAITTTGGGIINGDVGASPITGAAIGIPAAQVRGTIYEVDATGPAGAVVAPDLLTAAKGDLTMAYDDARDRTPVPAGTFLNPGSGNIGGKNLIAGLYKFTGTASITGGDLTLTGGPDDVWIFQIAADLQMGTNVLVVLAGGAQARNIFWQVTTTATIDTFSVFKGTILANQGITMNTGSTMEGRALSFTAGVVFNGDGGSISAPAAPVFTSIAITNTNSVTVTLNTAPFFLVSLQTNSTLSPNLWTTIATNTPATNLWSFTDTNARATVKQSHYRAFISVP